MTEQRTDPPADDEHPDAQERFRQAMEHKKQRSWGGVGGNAHPDDAKAKGDSHKHGGGRDFRRKSG